MRATVGDIIGIINRLIPPELAEPWDNCGLQVGRMDWPVHRIWIALDPMPAVVAAACRDHAQLLVCHHPLMFNPLKRLDFATPLGAIVQMAAQNGLAIFAAHTNLDKAAEGINTALARRLELSTVEPLTAAAPGCQSAAGHGLGRLGKLVPSRPLRHLALVKMVGRPDLEVGAVAICSGSGGGVVSDFLLSPAQVLVSGDLRYHDARTVEAVDRALVDIGHFGSERIAIDLLKTMLDREFAQMGIGADLVACPLEQEPFVVL